MNKTKIQTQSSADRITSSLSLDQQRKNKQTNKQKLSTNLTLYKAYTNHWTDLKSVDQQEERIQPLRLGKGDLKHNTLKKNNEKTEKYYTNEGTN